MDFYEALTPALIGGIIIGILSGIPVLNLFFPLFFIGGYVSAFLFEVLNEREIDEKDACKVGAYAGFFGSFFGGLIILILASFFIEPVFSLFKSEIGEFVLLLSGFDKGVNLTTLRNRWLFNVIVCTIFGTVGGLLYKKLKRKRKIE